MIQWPKKHTLSTQQNHPQQIHHQNLRSRKAQSFHFSGKVRENSSGSFRTQPVIPYHHPVETKKGHGGVTSAIVGGRRRRWWGVGAARGPTPLGPHQFLIGRETRLTGSIVQVRGSAMIAFFVIFAVLYMITLMIKPKNYPPGEGFSLVFFAELFVSRTWVCVCVCVCGID